MSDSQPNRKWLRHNTPNWIRTENERFFITICCEQRHIEQLTLTTNGPEIINSFEFCHSRGDWYGHLLLLMPDHLHAIMSFPEPATSIKKAISNWKRFTARRLEVDWQEGFFDHRLRGPDAWDEKAAYIRKNPVRAGLCAKENQWPWVWEPKRQGGLSQASAIVVSTCTTPRDLGIDHGFADPQSIGREACPHASGHSIPSY